MTTRITSKKMLDVNFRHNLDTIYALHDYTGTISFGRNMYRITLARARAGRANAACCLENIELDA